MKRRRNYLPLWTLLAVALATVVAVSALGPLKIGPYELKDSGIFGALTQSREAPAAIEPEIDMVADSIFNQEPAKAAEIDTASKRILFIGDSMLDGLYPRLAAYCQHNGHKLYAVIWYSSTSEIWGRSGRLGQYIGKLKPDYIFICLGANELFVKDVAAKRDRHVKALLAEIGEIPYLWIGPPNWKSDTGINSLIASNALPGSFFLSDGMQFERAKDGAHPTKASAYRWMDSVVSWMPANHPHPIRLERPPMESARASKVYVHQPDE